MTSLPTPEQYCRRIVKKSGSNFALAFGSLSRVQRRGMRAVYAFCRVVDDVVDGDGSPDQKTCELAAWREVVRAVAAGNVAHPLGQELLWATTQFHIPTRYYLELIDGCASDIAPQPVPDLAALEKYCYGVAGTVGLICLRIFGVEETAMHRAAAIALANAFQLTNILRDLHADAQIGRVYLPTEDLQRFHVPPSAFLQLPAQRDEQQRIAALIDFEITRAAASYETAWRGFSDVLPQMQSAQLMSRCYRAILSRIARDPLAIFSGRVRLPWWQKICVLVRGRAA